MSKDKKYRPCAGIVLVNKEKKVFIGERVDFPGSWQMPQGGIDKGEPAEDAALRELYEETGIKSVKILQESPDWIYYDFPQEKSGGIFDAYQGQKQKWFLMSFTGTEKDVNLALHEQEFSAWRWAEIDEVLEGIVAFKRDSYQEVFESFKSYFKLS